MNKLPRYMLKIKERKVTLVDISQNIHLTDKQYEYLYDKLIGIDMFQDYDTLLSIIYDFVYQFYAELGFKKKSDLEDWDGAFDYYSTIYDYWAFIHEYYSLANDDILKVIPYDALIRYDNTLISLPHKFIAKLKASNELDTNKVTEFYVKPAEVDNYQKVAYKDANKGWVITDDAIDMY